MEANQKKFNLFLLPYQNEPQKAAHYPVVYILPESCQHIRDVVFERAFESLIQQAPDHICYLEHLVQKTQNTSCQFHEIDGIKTNLNKKKKGNFRLSLAESTEKLLITRMLQLQNRSRQGMTMSRKKTKAGVWSTSGMI